MKTIHFRVIAQLILYTHYQKITVTSKLYSLTQRLNTLQNTLHEVKVFIYLLTCIPCHNNHVLRPVCIYGFTLETSFSTSVASVYINLFILTKLLKISLSSNQWVSISILVKLGEIITVKPVSGGLKILRQQLATVSIQSHRIR